MKFLSPLRQENSQGSFSLTLLEKQRLEIPPIDTWSMNIMIVNPLLNELYLADSDKLEIFALGYNLSASLKHILTLPMVRNEPSRINHMSSSTSLGEYILILLTYPGIAYIYFPDNWDRSPLKLDHFDTSFPDCSLWSCATFRKYLAIGSNTHLITEWNLETYTCEKISKHSHNIPCLDYNDQGFLASTSIDSAVTVIGPNRKSLECFPCVEWGCAVKWIKRNSICEVNELPRTNLPNLSGRYQSKLPTSYLNQNSDLRGVFDIANAPQYFRNIQQRINGLPFGWNSEYIGDTTEAAKEEIEIQEIKIDEDFQEFLLIQTSKNSVHLIEPGLIKATGKNSMHVLAVYIPSLQLLHRNISRLSLLNFIEQFSLCVIGNQFGGEVIFLRLCKCKNNKSPLKYEYNFFMEMSIILDGSILGLTVTQDLYSAFVYALTENMSFYVFKVTKNSIEKLVDLKV